MASGCADQEINPETPKNERKVCDCEPSKNQQKACDCEPLRKKQKLCDSDGDDGCDDEDDDIEYFANGLRELNAKEAAEYKRRVDASDGFDAPYFPHSGDFGLIIPCLALEEKAEKCILAIEDYNAKNNVKYEFVKVIKANVRIVGGAEYYLTFEAKNATDGGSQVFEALTWELMTDREVDFCRMKTYT